MHDRVKSLALMAAMAVCASVFAAGAADGNPGPRAAIGTTAARGDEAADLERVFLDPPDAARPRVLWMWMGCNITRDGITRDLEALHDAGFGGTTMFSISDSTTTWSADIGKSPTPDIITWSKPWWALVEHAARESKRLGMDFGMHNCAGYSTSGGPWITPELSAQEICWSQTALKGPCSVTREVARPQVDPRAVMRWPIFNSDLGVEEKPVIEARRTFYRDIALLAVPATGAVSRTQVVDLSGKLDARGQLAWDVPPGDWIVYRFGHTTQGTMQFPAQWRANGLECDKLNPAAVAFHANHIVGEARKHLGGLFGSAFTHFHFDSYEACTPSWTPAMREEFTRRRGYDPVPFLPVLAGRTIGGDEDTRRFKADFDLTISNLFRDAYFATISTVLKEAGIDFMAEPYGGPWDVSEAMAYVHRLTAEFWSDGGKYRPFETDKVIEGARRSGRNIIEAEALTSKPQYSAWCEYPAQMKTAGDTAFCEGINRFIVHRFVHQPWDGKHKPGATFGQWGTHLDRTQTWWEPGKAMVLYWQRCQALLQWGRYDGTGDGCRIVGRDESVAAKPPGIRYIRRRGESGDLFFLANLDPVSAAKVECSFAVDGRRPELWDPVRGTMRDLPEFARHDGRTVIPLSFAPGQSCFIVFRKRDDMRAGVGAGAGKNFPELKAVRGLTGAWDVAFAPAWGGPGNVVFERLDDWAERHEKGIKYYSGTAIYTKSFDLPEWEDDTRWSLDLGAVKHIASVRINDRDLGVVWCAPWAVPIPQGLIKPSGNRLEIKVTNVWANRLIGDEQEPPDCVWVDNKGKWPFSMPLKEFPDWFINGTPRPSPGRYCFTTWNYFKKDSPLVSSGLLGPVTVQAATGN